MRLTQVIRRTIIQVRKEFAMTEIDFEQLRKAIIEYYGMATNCIPAALGSVIEAESASNERLIEIAKAIGIIKE